MRGCRRLPVDKKGLNTRPGEDTRLLLASVERLNTLGGRELSHKELDVYLDYTPTAFILISIK